MITELYRSGKVKHDALGVLAKTVICIKVGCLPTGPEVAFAGITLQLAETISQTAPKISKPAKTQQIAKEVKPAERPAKKREEKPPPQPPQPPVPPPPPPAPKKEETRWDVLVSLLAQELKSDAARAESILTSLVNYLSVYPSVGVIRLIEDISRISKADQRSIKIALDVLRSAEIIEIKENGVVNLKKQIKKGEIPI